MSLVPAFELGVWNAWIFILPIIIIFYLILPKIFGGKRGSGEEVGLVKKERILSIIYLPIVFASYVYTIFLPLKLGTIWFYIGLPVYLLDIVIETLAMLSFNTTPVEKPVTKGVYSIFEKSSVRWRFLREHKHRHSLSFMDFSNCGNCEFIFATKLCGC